MLGDVVRDDGDEAPLLLGLSAVTLFFMMLSHTGGPRHHRHAQRPLTSLGRQTDEASSSW